MIVLSNNSAADKVLSTLEDEQKVLCGCPPPPVLYVLFNMAPSQYYVYYLIWPPPSIMCII